MQTLGLPSKVNKCNGKNIISLLIEESLTVNTNYHIGVKDCPQQIFSVSKLYLFIIICIF